MLKLYTAKKLIYANTEKTKKVSSTFGERFKNLKIGWQLFRSQKATSQYYAAQRTGVARIKMLARKKMFSVSIARCQFVSFVGCHLRRIARPGCQHPACVMT